MTVDDGQSDDVLACVAALKTYDLSKRHARDLRRRCHARLQPQQRLRRSAATTTELFRRVIGPALGGAWCLAYLAEIIRRAAAVYMLRP